MNIIDEILWGEDWAKQIQGMDYDPLVEPDALAETQLLDLRVHALSGSAAALFEMRTSLQFDRGNAGILIFRKVRSASWELGNPHSNAIAYSVMQSRPRQNSEIVEFDVRTHPRSMLFLAGAAAEFYLVDAHGIDEAPPDYAQQMSEIVKGIPNWGSKFSFIEGSRSLGIPQASRDIDTS
ncbi:hypothetical protein ACFOVU_11450 [Nocardiopsis sediminis]|uniref:Uncharacterized protein n=1 Tax=Nocardiopsis sediminis TaxID=1778267 RepID=A0ABV8FK79_9ACTN